MFEIYTKIKKETYYSGNLFSYIYIIYKMKRSRIKKTKAVYLILSIIEKNNLQIKVH